MREVAHARKRTPLSVLNKILQVVDIPDIITYINFCEDRLRGLGVAGGGQICPSPLTLIVATRPYNTLARRTTVRVCDILCFVIVETRNYEVVSMGVSTMSS